MAGACTQERATKHATTESSIGSCAPWHCRLVRRSGALAEVGINTGQARGGLRHNPSTRGFKAYRLLQNGLKEQRSRRGLRLMALPDRVFSPY